MRLWIGLSLLATLSACKRDATFFVYRISGRVVDSAGRAVRGAVVSRVKSAGSTVVEGFPGMYRQVTDGQGRFQFRRRSVELRTRKNQIWHLWVNHPRLGSFHKSLTIPWRADEKPAGYLLDGVVLRLPKR